jgi:hypothetical protein
MTTVACVYKTDPDNGLSSEYVHRLAENVREHTTRPHRFVCLTDSDEKFACETIRLTDNLARQWSKLELFKPRLSGRVIYFDIDTIIVRNIDRLMDYSGDVAMLHCWRNDWMWASGIMAWNVPLPCVLPTPDERARIDAGPKRGDQRFISRKLEQAGHTIDKVRDIVNAVSYRWHVMTKHEHVDGNWQPRPDSTYGVPEDADIVCFHGGPRPHEIGWKL